MSVFRAAAKVTSPDGREWEIYAYKIKVREHDSWDVDDSPLAPTAGADLVWILQGVVWLVTLIPRMLARIADLIWASLQSVRSDEWTIDAVTYLPHQTVYTWTTTTEFKGQVLAQVQGHLQRGDIPVHLRNALYRGEDRRSAR